MEIKSFSEKINFGQKLPTKMLDEIIKSKDWEFLMKRYFLPLAEGLGFGNHPIHFKGKKIGTIHIDKEGIFFKRIWTFESFGEYYHRDVGWY